jgi:hypothetical protein
MRKSALVSIVVMVLATAGTAVAQDAAPPAPAAPAAQPAPATAQAEPAAAEAPPAAPAEAPPAAAAETGPSSVPSGQEVAAAPGAAPAAEDEVYPPGWFRIDSDLNGLQLWVGATHDLGGLALASDAYVYFTPSGLTGGMSFGEFDLGPAFTLLDGGLIITPMVGINFNWTLQKTNAIVPQLYFVGSFDALYFESWWQMFIQKPFEDEYNGGFNYLYSRHFVTYNITDHVGIGVEADPYFSMDSDIVDDTVFRLPVGGVLKLHYGKDNTFLGFVGYETKEDARALAGGSGDRGIFGRLTFVKNW